MNAVVIPYVESDEPYAAYISCSETYSRISDLYRAGQIAVRL
jgi:hypothetical protein